MHASRIEVFIKQSYNCNCIISGWDMSCIYIFSGKLCSLWLMHEYYFIFFVSSSKLPHLQVWTLQLMLEFSKFNISPTGTLMTFTRLFWRKIWPVVIARVLLLSCKNFNVAHYSKSSTGIDTKLGILAHYDKMQLQD